MDAVVVTIARSAAEAEAVRLLVASLRRFGGGMRACPVWVGVVVGAAVGPADAAAHGALAAAVDPDVEVLRLDVPPSLAEWPYGAKVAAAARAEARAAAGTRSLIWLDPECLVVRLPAGLDLGEAADAAVRPVHLRGVGQPPGAPPDVFWAGVYDAIGAPRADAAGTESDDSGLIVESFVEGERLRPFFNSHSFAVRPSLGLCRRWLEVFEGLVGDAAFVAAACPDELHRVFLFQAVFSALVATTVAPSRLRLLPPTYNYPYNLHGRVPAGRRAAALEELVTLAYEGRSLWPAEVDDVAIGEPLRTWLTTALEDR